MEFARYSVWLSGYDSGSKVSRLATFKQVEKSLGRPPKELRDAPTLRPELGPVWGAFVDMAAGCDRISYTEIKSYCELVEPLEGWEIKAIKKMEAERHK